MKLFSITMYKQVLFWLIVIVFGSFVTSLFGWLTIPVWQLGLSFLVVAAICWPLNELLAKIWKVPANQESAGITALILFCIMAPVSSWLHAVAIAVAAIIAIASKYIIAYQGRQIFNPAAFGAAAVSLIGLGSATWWIGNQPLAAILAIAAVLIIVRLQLFRVAIGFYGMSLLVTIVLAASLGSSVSSAVEALIISSPLLFLSGIMLTEPSTLPGRRYWHLVYGGVVGLLFAGQFEVFGFYISPALALLAGNLMAFTVNPKQAVTLTLQSIDRVADTVYDLRFKASQQLQFVAGQYMYWTLPVAPPDIRGNRRPFTIASGPVGDEVRLGIRTTTGKGSAYKKALLDLKPGDTMTGSYVSGDFVLPASIAKPIVMIAGGIGITPFISMLEELLAHDNRSPVTVYYCNRSNADIYGRDILDKAIASGITVHYIEAQPADSFAQSEAAELLDQPDAQYYISGTIGMVQAFKTKLRRAGIKRRAIKTDNFAGY